MSTAALDSAISVRFASLESIIGNTPLLAIDYETPGFRGTVYAKSEQMNFTGSIKDRMALHILRQAYEEGRIRPAIRSWKRQAATPASPSPPSAVRSATR